MLSVLSNVYAHEVSVSTSTNITLPWRSRSIVLSNDSTAIPLQAVIGSVRMTLGASESLSVNLWLTHIQLSGTWRFWAFG